MKQLIFLFGLLLPLLLKAQESLVQEQLIYFESNKSNLNEDDKMKLEAFNTSLASNGDLKYKIYGHCDNVGSKSANQRLSIQRAKAVKAILVKNGVASNKIQYEGLSFDQPASDNATEDGRKMNRRVELKVYKVSNTSSKISGNVKSSKLGNLFKAIVKFKGESNTLTANTDAQGRYTIALPTNENYTVTVDFPSHFGFNKSLVTSGDMTLDITLEPLEENQKIKLSDLNFLSNKAVVSPKSMPTLDFINSQMQKDAKVCFEIGGHVNRPFNIDPNDTYLLDLSLARAVTVYDYLSTHGISKERMTPKGYGFEQMVKPQASDVNDILANMRVEIKVLNCDQVKKLILAEDANNINRVRLSNLFK